MVMFIGISVFVQLGWSSGLIVNLYYPSKDVGKILSNFQSIIIHRSIIMGFSDEKVIRKCQKILAGSRRLINN